MADDMEVVDLCESDEDDRKPAAVVKYDDVEIVDAPEALSDPMDICTTAAEAQGGEVKDDNDLTVMGTVNQVRLPHMRQHCPEFLFAADAMKFCDCCYCYICDVPVKECANWSSHSKATDEGPNAYSYKRQRLDSRNAKNPTQGSLTGAQHSIATAMITPDAHLKLQLPARTCKHCKSDGNSNYSWWCLTCGRVWCEPNAALEAIITLKQGKPYSRKKGDILLGTKTICFSLHPHDPRKITSVEGAWTQNEGKPGWVYDEKELAEDMFQSWIGQRPTLRELLMCIPVVQTENLPTDGVDSRRRFQTTRYNGSPSNIYDVRECQALILEDPNDRELLFQTYRVAKEFGTSDAYRPPHSFVDGDITASFNTQTGKGVSLNCL